MMKFYFHSTPNPMKVALLLEELEQPFELVPVDLFKGEQHDPAYRKINPNGKVPAIVDGDVTVFDSHAILIYLAKKHGRFLPQGAGDMALALSWLQLIATGLSPFSGQAVYFRHYAPQPLPSALTRYEREVARHYQVLDKRLGESPWLGGDEYGIADMALWGWAKSAGYIFGDKGLMDYPNVSRALASIDSRSAAARAWALRDNISVKTAVDDETMRSLFPHAVA